MYLTFDHVTIVHKVALNLILYKIGLACWFSIVPQNYMFEMILNVDNLADIL